MDKRPFVVIDEGILEGVKEEWAKTVQRNLKDKYPDGINVSGQHIDYLLLFDLLPVDTGGEFLL